MRKKLNVAVVGLGVGEQHILGYNRCRETQVTIICDLSEEKLHEVGSKYRGVKCTRLFDDVLQDITIDIISIATFDDVHAEQVILSLKAGKHVFVEKPLCQTLKQARDIKSILMSQGGSLKLMSNFVLRTSPLYVWLKKEISSGTFGKIYAFDGDYLYGRISKITEGWRKDVNDYSVMEGGGIHLIDLFLWLTGEKPVSLFTVGNRICTKNTLFRYDDFMATSVITSSGIVARFTANFGCVHRHHHILRIFGTKATFIYDDMGPRIHYSRDPSTTVVHMDIDPLPASKGDLIPAFVNALIKDEDISDQIQMLFDEISICFASDESLKYGMPVLVDYI